MLYLPFTVENIVQVLEVVNVWLSMGFPLILLPILKANYTKEMSLLQEMLPLGKALVILYPLLEAS